MSVTATQVLNVARAELGTAEDPAGSNRVKYSTWYGLVGAWCAMFVSWVAAHAGAEAVIPRHAWTPSGAAWFKARGRYDKTPRRGSIVYFRWPGMTRISHVGIVEDVLPDGRIVTIEGNTDVAGGRTGGKVLRQVRAAFVDGYGHPEYTPEAGRPAPPAVLAAPVRPTRRKRSPRSLGVTRRGSRGARRTSLEAFLQRIAGVDDDGVIGQVSQRAFVALQRALGVKPDGEIGPVTIRALFARAGVLRHGSLGDVVRLLQLIVQEDPDGAFGDLTEEAVRECQAWAGITEDGEVGPDTRGAIVR